MLCPKCGGEVIMTSHLNQRNGKWTALPLELDGSSFAILGETHEAFGILGDSLGELLVSIEAPGEFRPHPPSHFLEA
jgi:hypothetical protein